MNISQATSTHWAHYSSSPEPPASDKPGENQQSCAGTTPHHLTPEVSATEIKERLSANLDCLNTFLLDAADDITISENIAEALHLFLLGATEHQKNQVACLLCNNDTNSTRILHTIQLNPHRIELYARNIVENPYTTAAQLDLINPFSHKQIFDFIYFKLGPDKTTLDIVTEQLHDRFKRSSVFLPELHGNWAKDCMDKYPKMLFPRVQTHFCFSKKLTHCIQNVFFPPVSEVTARNLESLFQELNEPENAYVARELLPTWLCRFIESNTHELTERTDLLVALTTITSPLPLHCSGYRVQFPFRQPLFSALMIAEKKALKSLKLKLERTTDQDNNLHLFTEWLRMVLHKTNFMLEAFNQTFPGHDYNYWVRWAEEQRKSVDELIAMALNSAVLGKPEYWTTIDQKALKKFEQAGLSFDKTKDYDSNPVFTVLHLVRHSDQKRYLDQWHQRMTEQELVMIATRAVPEVARHIISNTRPLSLEALAEIGRCHPQWVVPMVEQGDFQSPEAVPALVRFASAFELLAEVVLLGQYNQHLTPSWRARLAANFPRLSEQIWAEFCQCPEHSHPSTCLSEEWLEAVAHICQHEAIAKKVLQHPGTSASKDLLMRVAFHHKSFISQELINALKDHTRFMGSIIKAHGFATVSPMLTQAESSEITKKMFAEKILKPEDNPELVPADDDTLNFHAALAWRDRAEALKPDDDRWQSQSTYNKHQFLTRWPHLHERFPAQGSLSLQQAFELLKSPVRWPTVTASEIVNICRFPSVAEKVCFDPSYQVLVNKLTPDQQFDIWESFPNTANLALNQKSLNTNQIAILLSSHFTLVYRHLDKLSKCSNFEISQVFSEKSQQDNAMTLLTSKNTEIMSIRDRLKGKDWVDIASSHEKVAVSLFGGDHESIRNKLTESHIYQLAFSHKTVLNSILDDTTIKKISAPWSPQHWVHLCKQYPEFFNRIYQIVKHSSPECQEAFSVSNLLQFRNHSALWRHILASMSESDRRWLLAQSGSVPVARHQVNIPHQDNADFYPFHHPLWGVMNRKGCCVGYAQDFIRYARKHKNPAGYFRKATSSWIKKSPSVMPYRVTALQQRQALNYRVSDKLIEPSAAPGSPLDLTPALAILEQKGETLLISKDHISAIYRSNKDLYYFEPNTGVWRWRDFDPARHQAQLTRTVENTLFKTGAGSLKVEATQRLLGLHFPKKQKAEFQPEWLSKLKHSSPPSSRE